MVHQIVHLQIRIAKKPLESGNKAIMVYNIQLMI